MSSFQDILTDYEIASMQSQLRAMTRKRDNMAIDIAKIQNLPNIWSTTMIDWDDPNISSIKDSFLQLEKDITALARKLEEAEAIRNDEWDKLIARRKVNNFLKSISDEEALEYLHSIKMTTIGLIDAVRRNPNFIKETYGVVA